MPALNVETAQDELAQYELRQCKGAARQNRAFVGAIFHRLRGASLSKIAVRGDFPSKPTSSLMEISVAF